MVGEVLSIPKRRSSPEKKALFELGGFFSGLVDERLIFSGLRGERVSTAEGVDVRSWVPKKGLREFGERSRGGEHGDSGSDDSGVGTRLIRLPNGRGVEGVERGEGEAVERGEREKGDLHCPVLSLGRFTRPTDWPAPPSCSSSGCLLPSA